MDVNGTRFHLLLGERDWGSCSVEGAGHLADLWRRAGDAEAPLEYDAGRDELILRRRLFEFRTGGARRLLTPDARRGAARDRYGNWYWVDPARRGVLVRSSGSGETTRFWGPGDGTLARRREVGGFEAVVPEPTIELLLGGMAVTEDHYLVAGLVDPPGILVFDLQGGGAPERMVWPPAVAFSPFDLAARPGGGVFVLDRSSRAYWEIDRSFCVVPRGAGEEPEPATGFEPRAPEPSGSTGTEGAPRRFRTPSSGDPVELPASIPGAPVALEALPDATVLVLFHDEAARVSTLASYRDGAPAAAPVRLPNPDQTFFAPGHDMAALPHPEDDYAPVRLLVADRGGDQAFEYLVSLRPGALGLSLVPRYYPMRLFGGKAIVAGGDGAYYDLRDGWVPLAEQPRRRYAPAAFVETPPFDGGEPGCVWHRLMLDACLPSETEVRVWSAAGDDAALLESYPTWVPEPPLYARGDGSELPWAGSDPSRRYRTWELLFQRAEGRYLRVRMELVGNERATPRVRALRAYYPRFSYLERYLPAVYREDEQSGSFLDRFLANVEGFYTSIEDRIANAQMLFDPATAPGEALEWLGRWFGLAMDPAWSRPKQRLLLRHAMEFFRWRGTVRGVRAALALALEDEVDESLFGEHPGDCALRTRIVERYQTKETPAVVLGDPSDASSTLFGGATRWHPSDGAEELHRSYGAAVQGAGPGAPARFPVRGPDVAGPVELEVWEAFARRRLGFVPAADASDLSAWREFLARRYGHVNDLNSAYGLLGTAALARFDDAPLPATLPEDDPALSDWFEFEAVVVASRRTAHRFRVLLPVSARTRRDVSDPVSTFERGARLDLAHRIVELEKPAHTVFDVKFYWEAFRVGEARLGVDTLIDLGGRSPGLAPPAVLGTTFVGEAVLTSPAAATEATRRPLFRRSRS